MQGIERVFNERRQVRLPDGMLCRWQAVFSFFMMPCPSGNISSVAEQAITPRIHLSLFVVRASVS